MPTPNPLDQTNELPDRFVAPLGGRLVTLDDDSALSPEEVLRRLASPGQRHVLGGRVGRYHVREALGEGGMGTVVEAYDETLGRKVALKLLHERQAGQDALRLLREAQALARLSHPNVVQVYEVGELEGRLFIAMERIDGSTLERWHANSRSWQEVLEVYLQAGKGLAAAHDAGLVHRDFKPSNCVIDRTGRVRVLDFGLARDVAIGNEPPMVDRNRMSESSDGQGSDDGLMLDRAITNPGSLMGTIAYMAPEQLLGLCADARSDQFAFCVALYEALYRDSPFIRGPIRDISQLATAASPLPPKAFGVPAEVWRVLRRGLQREPEARWPSMHVLLERLGRVPIRGRRVRRGVALVVCMLGVIGLMPSFSPPSAASVAGSVAVAQAGVEAAADVADQTHEQLERTFAWATAHRHDALSARAARRLSEVLAHGSPEAARAWQLMADGLEARGVAGATPRATATQ